MIIKQEILGNCHYGENEHKDYKSVMRVQNNRVRIQNNVRERGKKDIEYFFNNISKCN